MLRVLLSHLFKFFREQDQVRNGLLECDSAKLAYVLGQDFTEHLKELECFQSAHSWRQFSELSCFATSLTIITFVTVNYSEAILDYHQQLLNVIVNLDLSGQDFESRRARHVKLFKQLVVEK